MKRFVLPVVLAVSSAFAGPVEFVDPMVGTATTGHTFPGAVLPHGGVQLSPDTGFDGWEHCSGYHHDDKKIIGFSHTHLSGTGCPELGDVLVAPHVGDVQFEPGGYSSEFDHANEVAKAGYYSVKLDRFNVRAELTATSRVGIHRYTFPSTDKANLNFEITNQIGGQKRTFSAAKWISPTELAGAIYTDGWAHDQHLFFVARFSRPAVKAGIAIDNKEAAGKTEVSGKIENLDAYATFDATKDPTVVVKVAISNVSIEGARKNLQAETKDSFDFDAFAKGASEAWDKQLDQFGIDGATDSQKRTFYTAAYHAHIHPSLYDDVDGQYLGMDRKVHQMPAGQHYYHIYSLWDTYRAAHPLYDLLNPTLNLSFVSGLLERSKLRGELPVWELCSFDNYCMIGDPAVPVVANAVINGEPLNKSLALKAVKDSLAHKGRGQTEFLQYGYCPCDKTEESVSKTLEFAYANGAAAKMAKYLGKDADAKEMWERSQAYRKVFNAPGGLMWPKKSDGSFVADYNPVRLDYEPRYVTEGNSWQYNWLVMQDLPGLAEIYGGKEKAAEQLAKTFDVNNKPVGAQSDVTGLIGQYAHGNEPSHHTVYLFVPLGRPDLAEKYIREVRDTLYTDKVDGLCGNDDAGQMSAWYVFSAMGFYPLDPASGAYVLGLPSFPKMTVTLENGRKVTIQTKNLDLKTGSVKEITWNGQPLPDRQITHKQLSEGGTLEFVGS